MFPCRNSNYSDLRGADPNTTVLTIEEKCGPYKGILCSGPICAPLTVYGSRRRPLPERRPAREPLIYSALP